MQAFLAFLESLYAGVKARLAARAGAEMKRGETEIAATFKDIQDIEGELKRCPAEPNATPSAATLPARGDK